VRIPARRKNASVTPAGASFTVLDGVAHLAALEDPARVNRLLDEFLFDAGS
jgi:3-oxoadipate enol-lactonase